MASIQVLLAIFLREHITVWMCFFKSSSPIEVIITNIIILFIVVINYLYLELYSLVNISNLIDYIYPIQLAKTEYIVTLNSQVINFPTFDIRTAFTADFKRFSQFQRPILN